MQGEPSKKQRRAAKNLSIRMSMYTTAVSQSQDGGKSLTKPGGNQMH